ncbi:vacuolar protein sorting-associated protein 4A-like [Ornithodoros turicata]|uniref:vacuolar protein sorting-associated protein 4A-like n=1 Tax=Ornithodoros turicata TaxID=34597 RepID=UPI003138A24A
MDAEEAVRRAMEYAKRATEEDRAENFAEAFRLYKHALLFYFMAAKEIRQESSQYIQRTHEFVRFLGTGGDPLCTSVSTASITPFTRAPEELRPFQTSGVVVMGESELRWSHVYGLESLKRSLVLNVIYPVQYPTIFHETGAKLWRSLIMYGPTGCGKSHVAKALATEAHNFTFFDVMCPHFVSKVNAGNESLTVYTLFEMVVNHAPSILFLDEIDALSAPVVNGETVGFLYKAKNEFLSILEDIIHNRRLQVAVLAATRSPWAVDPGLARLFQKWAYVPLPSVETREIIFKENLRHLRHNLGEDDIDKLVQLTEGLTCEDILLLVRETRLEIVERVLSATHFKKTATNIQKFGKDKVNEQLLTPCAPSETGAIRMSWKDVPREALIEPELTMDDFKAVLKRGRTVVSATELQKFDAFRLHQDPEKTSLVVDMRGTPSRASSPW